MNEAIDDIEEINEVQVEDMLEFIKKVGYKQQVLQWVCRNFTDEEILNAIDDTFPMVEYLREAGYWVEVR
jgi:hypothetical protein